MVSTIKTIEFKVKPKIPLENKVYPETYYHHSKLILKWMRHQPKFKYKILIKE